LNNKIAFFKESLKSFKTTGTILPSSRFLINRMLSNVDFKNARVIVEYGPGNGIITEHILKRMHKDAVLICFEINKEFYNHLTKNSDSRLIVINQSAENIKLVLENNNFNFIDCFISSLPLSILPKEISHNILEASKEVLRNNGKFIQYQYSTSFLKIFKQVFGNNNVFLNFELLNVPPAFIYKCVKK